MKNISGMKNKILLLSFLITTIFVQAQDSLKVAVFPKQNFPWSILSELKDVKQMYVDNKQLNKDSLFVYNMSGKKPGMYLLMYDMDAHNFVYFIYNHEPVELEIYPTEHNRIKVIKSKENKVFINYLKEKSPLVIN